MAERPLIWQEIPRELVGIPLINICLVCLNVRTRNARKSIKPSKNTYCSLESKNLWATKSAWLVGSQEIMTSSKCKQICINIFSLCKHQQKTRDLKLKFFFSLIYKSSRVFEGLEQLSSLFWRRVMTIYKLGVIHPRSEFVGVEILPTAWFLWHSFGSRYARKPFKGLKTRMMV